MKKLYAIRNKKTGELLDRWNSFENNAKIAKAGLADSGSYETVTLRIEPVNIAMDSGLAIILDVSRAV